MKIQWSVNHAHNNRAPGYGAAVTQGAHLGISPTQRNQLTRNNTQRNYFYDPPWKHCPGLLNISWTPAHPQNITTHRVHGMPSASNFIQHKLYGWKLTILCNGWMDDNTCTRCFVLFTGPDLYDFSLTGTRLCPRGRVVRVRNTIPCSHWNSESRVGVLHGVLYINSTGILLLSDGANMHIAVNVCRGVFTYITASSCTPNHKHSVGWNP